MEADYRQKVRDGYFVVGDDVTFRHRIWDREFSGTIIARFNDKAVVEYGAGILPYHVGSFVTLLVYGLEHANPLVRLARSIDESAATPHQKRASEANRAGRAREPKGRLTMTADEAIRWAETRACKGCRSADKAEHDACEKARTVAGLLRELVEKAVK